MIVSVLIPWRTDHGHRERLWTYLRPLWQALPNELVTASDGRADGEPFDYATAANRAASEAAGSIYVTWGADQLPDQAAINTAAETARTRGWAGVFTRTAYWSPFDTERILAGANPGPIRPETVYDNATGILAVRADAWNAIGGMDERFHGWGYEDAALRARLTSDYGHTPTRPGTLRGLWHPVRHRVFTGPNAELYYREYAPGRQPW